MVAATAREYLANLSADAGKDPTLNRELSESYYRLSRVEMSAGESAASMDHLRKSIDVLKSLRDDCCGAPRERARYILWVADLARYEDDSRSQQEARKLSAEAVRAARAWIAQAPHELLAEKALCTALSTEGHVLSVAAEAARGRKDLEEATQLAERMYGQHPQDDDVGFELARAAHWLAGVIGLIGDTPRRVSTKIALRM